MNFSGRRWLTVNEVAQMLSLHPVTVRRKIDRGEIKTSRIGRTIRIDLKRLEAELEREMNSNGKVELRKQ